MPTQSQAHLKGSFCSEKSLRGSQVCIFHSIYLDLTIYSISESQSEAFLEDYTSLDSK